MVNLDIHLETKTHEIPKAEYDFRMGNVIHILAEMVLEAVGQDSMEISSRIPSGAPVDLPLVSGKVPSQIDHTKVLDV